MPRSLWQSSTQLSPLAAPLVLWLPAPSIASALEGAEARENSVGLGFSRSYDTDYIVRPDTELASAARLALRCPYTLPAATCEI